MRLRNVFAFKHYGAAALCVFFLIMAQVSLSGQTPERADPSDMVNTEATKKDPDKELPGKKKETWKSEHRHDDKGIIVTATKTRTLADKLPVTAYTVDRDDIESQPEYGRNNYGELVRNVPGVNVAQAPMTAPPWVNMRGTGYFVGRTLYLLDGLPVATSTTPMLTTTINNNDIERIDILLGASSALYGSNASGGVINIVTRQGRPGMGTHVGTGYGSQNTWRPHAGIGDRMGNFHYYVSYSGDYSDGYKMQPVDQMRALYNSGKKSYIKSASLENNEYRSTHWAANFGWEDENGAGFFVAYNFANLYVGGGQKNAISLDNGNQGVGSVRVYTPIGDFMKITATAGHQFWDRPGKSNKGLSLVGGNLVFDPAKQFASESKLVRIPAELQSDFYFGKSDILTVGVFYSTEKMESEINDWVTGQNKSKSKTTTDQYACYIQNQLFLLNDRLTVLAGLRYDGWRYYDIYDSASDPKDPEGMYKDTVTYRGGIKYKINEVFAVRSSGGTAFWPGASSWFFKNTNAGNTWNEANRNLKPEKTWMVDAGLECKIREWGTSMSITPYYGRITDMILYRYDQHPTLPAVSIVRTRNVGEAEIYGVESVVEQRIFERIFLHVSHTQNHSRIVKDPTPYDGVHPNLKGNQISNAPDYQGSAGIRYFNPAVVNMQATLRYSGQRYYDNDNTDLPCYKMKPFQTVDIKLWRDWTLYESLIVSAAFSCNDVFDETYNSEFIYVNPGRTWQVNVGARYLY